MSYNKHQLPTLHEHLGVTSGVVIGSVFLCYDFVMFVFVLLLMYLACISRLSILDCPFGFRLFDTVYLYLIRDLSLGL